jgi:ankyrin repeat protein
MIFHNTYLDDYLLSFLDIPTTIQLLQVSKQCHLQISSLKQYISLRRCSNINVSSICEKGDLELLKWYEMTVPYDKDHAFIKSATYGNLEITEYLLQKGANIYADNGSALYWSIINGHLYIAQYLIVNGIDIHIHDDGPLRLSADCGHLSMVEYLIDLGADVHAQNDFAFRSSAKKGHLEIVRYLVEHGADIHACEDEVLKYCAKHRKSEIIDYLSQYDMDLLVYIEYAYQAIQTIGFIS